MSFVSFFTEFSFQQFFSAFLVLFAVIDSVGAIPVILNTKKKGRIVDPKRGSIFCLIMLLSFFFVGDAFLSLFHLDISSFAVAGSLVIFFIGMEMILDVEIFKQGAPTASKDATFIPIAFPLLTGAGVLTTLLSIRSQFDDINILIAIFANVILIYFILKLVERIEQVLGKGVIYMMQKFFGVILLAISIKLFVTNVAILADSVSK